MSRKYSDGCFLGLHETTFQGKSKKVPVVKFKRRKNYLRQGTHRQFFTEIEIVSIGKGKTKSNAPKEDEKKVAKKQQLKKI